MKHMVTADRLADLIAQSSPGHSLAQAFYRDPAIYRRDLERVFMASWLYAGHISEVPKPGDYFLFQVGDESVIVVRGRDGEIRALVNVCRHRGSRVCVEQKGSAKRFMCPYHAWTYDLDGRLVAARLMPEGFDKAAHGLTQLHVRVFEGFIFVNFAETPDDFAALEEDLAPRLKPAAKTGSQIRTRATLAVPEVPARSHPVVSEAYLKQNNQRSRRDACASGLARW